MKLNRLKMMKKVMMGSSIIITKEDNKITVDAGTNSPKEVRDIATSFFKEAYNLKR